MRGTQITKGADLAVWGSTCDNGAWGSDYNSRDWLFLNWTEKVRIESYSWIFFASLCGTHGIQKIPDFFCPELKILTTCELWYMAVVWSYSKIALYQIER